MSNEIFTDKPDLQEYFETSDGTQFYKEDLARNHGRTLEDKTVKNVSRNDVSETESAKETAKEILAKLPEMDLETAEEYLEAENSDEFPRKTVVAALTKRIAELEGSDGAGTGEPDSTTGDENQNQD